MTITEPTFNIVVIIKVFRKCPFIAKFDSNGTCIWMN